MALVRGSDGEPSAYDGASNWLAVPGASWFSRGWCSLEKDVSRGGGASFLQNFILLLDLARS